MAFELFGPAKREDIRVAYISPDQGLVENVSICDANAYAKLNPGTVFIFKRRDKIKYLNINGVNALTPDDMLPEEEECPGITGLDRYNADGTPKQFKKQMKEFKPMLARVYTDDNQIDWSQPVYMQPKLDGVRCIFTRDGAFSRTGKRFMNVKHIEMKLQELFINLFGILIVIGILNF